MQTLSRRFGISLLAEVKKMFDVVSVLGSHTGFGSDLPEEVFYHRPGYLCFTIFRDSRPGLLPPYCSDRMIIGVRCGEKTIVDRSRPRLRSMTLRVAKQGFHLNPESTQSENWPDRRSGCPWEGSGRRSFRSRAAACPC